MPNFRLSRRKLLAGAAPLVAAPAVAKLSTIGAAATFDEHTGHEMGASHAAMIGA